MNVISLKRYSEPVCRKLEKAVCVAACCKAVSMVLLAFPAVGMLPAGECGQCWERMDVGYMSENMVLRTGGREFLLHDAKWVILHIIAVDFEVSYMCLQWILHSCVGGGSLGICMRLGLISPLRTTWGLWWARLDITRGLLAGSVWSWRSAWSKLHSDLLSCSLTQLLLGIQCGDAEAEHHKEPHLWESVGLG